MRPPINGWSWSKITQLFGMNSAFYNSYFGTPGHNGLDLKGNSANNSYGTPIVAAHDGIVSSITWDDPNHTRGTGIYLRSLDNRFYTNYWHLSGVNVNIGQQVSAGQQIGKMGNSGLVSPKPTPSNPYAGTHLHFGMKWIGLVNDYKGFIDPTPLLYKPGDRLPFRLNRDLAPFSKGDDVSYLQTLMKLQFSEITYQPIAYYGMQTSRDVSRFQRKWGISSVGTGVAGPLTRSKLNSLYSTTYTIRGEEDMFGRRTYDVIEDDSKVDGKLEDNNEL